MEIVTNLERTPAEKLALEKYGKIERLRIENPHCKIRELREALGLTTRDVADALGLSHTVLLNWEKDQGMPKLCNAKAVAHFFGKTVEEIWP